MLNSNVLHKAQLMQSETRSLTDVADFYRIFDMIYSILYFYCHGKDFFPSSTWVTHMSMAVINYDAKLVFTHYFSLLVSLQDQKLLLPFLLYPLSKTVAVFNYRLSETRKCRKLWLKAGVFQQTTLDMSSNGMTNCTVLYLKRKQNPANASLWSI